MPGESAIYGVEAAPVLFAWRLRRERTNSGKWRQHPTGRFSISPVCRLQWPADMGEVNAVVERGGVPVVEDARQRLGAIYTGQKSCTRFSPASRCAAATTAGQLLPAAAAPP